ncbi:TetR family transcriptional regulator [Flavobacterium sp. 316]|uniref:TetR/AcrR family transcriptional regulator n=1 Tax=Flavobacterium sediminilitoris TaxID=2024526 RepID=A0ABY4HR74_9FLAO|nr:MULTISPECIES: TetR/AcrR family transcriptional regulator [Flavobacterium]KIX21086.1 TetR family transcriptional regulator [Flavobacterium sp. 316]UOX35185.1 TetR/AcrR family transcriptional regulator [Flavobacterium sediminilitoris]
MKEQILSKATEMFVTLGFKSVTMDDIAAELGISKKTIYLHFSTKPELVKHATFSLFETISCGIDSIRAFEKNPIEELFEIKNFVLQHLKDEGTSPIYQLQKYYPKIYITLRSKQFEKMDDCIVYNLQKGISLGLYRKEIMVDAISRFYFAGMTSIKDGELFPNTMFNPKELQNQYLEYHLRGICSPKGIEFLNQLIKTNN